MGPQVLKVLETRLDQLLVGLALHPLGEFPVQAQDQTQHLPQQNLKAPQHLQR